MPWIRLRRSTGIAPQWGVAAQPTQGAFIQGACFFFRSIMRQTKGVKMSCIANSILPPGTTMVLARLIHESLIMFSRY